MNHNTFNRKITPLSTVLIFFIISAISISIKSCSSIEEPLIPTLDIPEKYNEVGQLHNEALEFAFERIKEQAIESVKNPTIKRLFAEDDNYNEFVKQVTLDFCKQNIKLQKKMDFIEKFSEKEITTKIGRKSLTEEISPTLQKFFNEIELVFSKEFQKDELIKLKTQLDIINKNAAETLSEEEAAIVFCGTSTGYSSYQYWMNNNTKWIVALNFPEILEQYNNDELNQLKIKNGNIVRMGWWSDLFDTVEGWWQAVANWWNDAGAEIILNDIAGSVIGAGVGYLEGGDIDGVISAGIFFGAGASIATAIGYYFPN